LNKLLKKLSEENLGSWGVEEGVKRYDECIFRMFVIPRQRPANKALEAGGFVGHLHFRFVPSL
jgi:hypothetical protein